MKQALIVQLVTLLV